ncbi:glycosyltransferase family 2 protein [Nocardia rhizosphaerae]|uniref:Glycosyltransferase family 2 protein n=1 Tax=Nocardia rhizosphaerae TaxID=1691571 RepID=A0ABV8L282_9NOCA
MSTAVVTTCWGAYGRYLTDWAESIAGQTQRPTQAVIADLGVDDPDTVAHATEILRATDVPCDVVTGEYAGMGAARNTAVAATRTEWVMHLDADDTLLPHALADVAELTGQADVVSLGAIRDGRPVCFPDVSRERILARGHGAFSCSPFRRSLWERRPFHTANDWVDSVLWVGFAHLGARFAGTTRPGFVYRQHDDSFSHQLTAEDRRQAVRQWKHACRSWELA